MSSQGPTEEGACRYRGSETIRSLVGFFVLDILQRGLLLVGVVLYPAGQRHTLTRRITERRAPSTTLLLTTGAEAAKVVYDKPSPNVNTGGAPFAA